MSVCVYMRIRKKKQFVFLCSEDSCASCLKPGHRRLKKKGGEKRVSDYTHIHAQTRTNKKKTSIRKELKSKKKRKKRQVFATEKYAIHGIGNRQKEKAQTHP